MTNINRDEIQALQDARMWFDTTIPDNNEWVCSYRDDAGTVHELSIGGTDDDSIEELAFNVSFVLPSSATGQVRVIGDRGVTRGVINLQGGVVTSWRAL